MTSALIGSITQGLFAGSASYGICRGFSHSHPFEKAVLVTVLVGLRELSSAAIKHLRAGEHGLQSRTRFLTASITLLAIPCTLYAGRIFKFKEADYLQILGLASLGNTITYGLKALYDMYKGK